MEIRKTFEETRTALEGSNSKLAAIQSQLTDVIDRTDDVGIKNALKNIESLAYSSMLQAQTAESKFMQIRKLASQSGWEV